MSIKIKDLEALAEDLKKSYRILADLQDIGISDDSLVYEEVLTKILENNLEVIPEAQTSRTPVGYILFNKLTQEPLLYHKETLPNMVKAINARTAYLTQNPLASSDNIEIKEIFI